MDNIFFNCITDKGLEKGMFLCIVYSKNEVYVEKIYSWSDK